MTKVIRYRGPDDEGYALFSTEKNISLALGGEDTLQNCYSSNFPYKPIGSIDASSMSHVAFALGHRRLSVIDLSVSGHQPMCSPDSRYWIVYNGEVYNYRELRLELEQTGYGFLSHSDTEVIIAAYQKWGKECLSRFNGMFAFLIYDSKEHRLFVARDRFGVKPLYYRVSSCGIAFASEIKQFTVLPDWQAKLNGQRVYDFLNWNVIDHTAETLFDGVFQLRGGEMLELELKQVVSAAANNTLSRLLPVTKWYQLQPAGFTQNRAAAVETFKNLLFDAVRLRLRSDVQIGSCLSGGVDSSSIVCIMHAILVGQNSVELQKTFSACSDDKRFDERQFIEKVVAETRVESHYVFPEVDDLFSMLNNISWHQDEPFGSTSIYAQWCVFKSATNSKVKVMLDGQGADELLGGYKPYFASRYAGLLKHGHWLKLWREVRAAKHYYGRSEFEAFQYIAYILLPYFLRQGLLQLSGREQLNPDWLNLSALGAQPSNPLVMLGNKSDSVQALSYAQLTATSLPMLLHWEDRNSMAHSVEARLPFLDYRLVEFALGLSEDYKISEGITKRILRDAMTGLLPVNVQNRKDKMGFVTAEREWMTKQEPDRFKQYIREAMVLSNCILTNKARERAFAIIDGYKPFNHLPWRIISLGNWMRTYNITMN